MMSEEYIFLFFHLFFVSFFFNLFWELAHSVLYETCLRAPLQKYVLLIMGAAAKDGFWITVFYGVTAGIFQRTDILKNPPAIGLFVILALIFSFFDERISLGMKRWSYAPTMPRFLGVGITPLLELVVTGLLAVWYVVGI